MKKFLLPLCAFGFATGIQAVDNPYIIPDAVILGFSPDNRVAVSQINNTVFFFDLESDEAPLIFSESEDALVGYNVSSGNFLSNNTILVGRKQEGSSAWRWNPTRGVHNGRWYTLNDPQTDPGIKTEMGSPNGITADGTRVCGTYATGASFASDDGATMVIPCFWDYKDGSYTRTMLPYPDKDYSGMAPQYVTAVAISDSGKTIVGQSCSNNGFLVEFLLYKQDADGNWTYTKPFADLVNPNNLQLPEYPSDESPAVPSPEAYLDEEGKAAYDAAYEEFMKGLGEEPDVTKYLTADSIAAYNAQVDLVNEWVKKYEAYRAVDLQILTDSESFVFNTVSISPNGKYFCGSAVRTYVIDELGSTYSVYTPYLYDIEKGCKVEIPTDRSVLLTGVSDLGDLIGYERLYDVDYGYALPAGATEWQPLEQYVVDRNPDLADWVKENWEHEVQVIVDEEEGIVEMQRVFITGVPIPSRDFSHISTAAYTFWTDGPEEYYQRFCSWIVPFGNSRSAIDEVSAGTAAKSDGAYFDLQGRRMATPAASGIYIHDGKKVIVK